MGKQRRRTKSLLIRLALLAIFLVQVHRGPAAILPRGIAEARTPSTTCIPGRVTPSVTEGPFYKSGSPQRASLLEPGMAGTKLVITGQIFSKSCRPVAGAWLDFWQADARGAYDNAGYRLRGHQFTDSAGRDILESVMPGGYPGRTPNIHGQVMGPNRPGLKAKALFP